MPSIATKLVDGPLLPPPRAGGYRRPLLRGAAAALLIAAALVLVVKSRPLLVGFAHLFRVDDPAPSDAMLVLTAWPDEPVSAYQRGWAPELLMVPNGAIPFEDLNQSVIVHTILTRRGVPPQAIRVLPPVPLDANYRAIAQRVREDLQRRPIRRLLIAADSIHTARIRRIFREVFRGLDTDVRMLAVANPWFDESRWYRSDEGLVAYFAESISVLHDALVNE
jgi:hypothetical protein